VPIPGSDKAELVGYLVMRRDENGTVTPRAVLDMRGIEDLVVDAETPVPVMAIESFSNQLAAIVRDEFRVFAAAHRIEDINEKAGRAQMPLTHLVAKEFILPTQRAYRGEANFSKQLDILDEIVETRPEQRLPRMPVDKLRSIATAGVPFALRLSASGDKVPFGAPHPLLKAAVDLAAREADALHRPKASVTTEQVRGRL
jgi:hypothetical protein